MIGLSPSIDDWLFEKGSMKAIKREIGMHMKHNTIPFRLLFPRNESDLGQNRTAATTRIIDPPRNRRGRLRAPPGNCVNMQLLGRLSAPIIYTSDRSVLLTVCYRDKSWTKKMQQTRFIISNRKIEKINFILRHYEKHLCKMD